MNDRLDFFSHSYPSDMLPVVVLQLQYFPPSIRFAFCLNSPYFCSCMYHVPQTYVYLPKWIFRLLIVKTFRERLTGCLKASGFVKSFNRKSSLFFCCLNHVSLCVYHYDEHFGRSTQFKTHWF